MKGKLIIKRYIEGPLDVNTYFLIAAGNTESEAVIIDPGGKSHGLVKEIEKSGLRLKYIINTHCHIDHIAFNRYFKDKFGGAIMVHRADAGWLDKKQDDFLFSIIGGRLSPAAEHLLDDGDTIEIGDIGLRVIHTPGHTPGSICLSGDGFIFTGDTLFSGSVGRTDLPGGSYEDLMQSINEKILQLPDEIKIYPGHGGESTIGEERLTNPFLQL